MSSSASLESTPPVSVRGVLEPDEIRSWRQPSALRLFLDFGLIWLQCVVPIAVFVWWPNPLTFVAAFLLVGGGQHGLHLVVHEFSHYAVVPSNRRLNDLIGIWLFAAPLVFPYKLFRWRHFAHHRLYSTAHDTKTVYRKNLRGWRLSLELLKWISGWEYLYHVFEVKTQSADDRTSSSSPPPSTLEMLPPIIVVQLVIFGIFWFVNPWLYFALWLAPLFTLVQLFGNYRAMMEHAPLDSEGGGAPGSGYFKDTPGPFVRTTMTNWIERLFITKINFHYHAEHHVWPQLSYQHLPKAHQRMMQRGMFDDPRFGLQSSYTNTIRELARPADRGSTSSSTNECDERGAGSAETAQPVS